MTSSLAGRYRLEQRLGRGSSGEVWAATDEVLGRPVAVKLLRTTGEVDGDLEARFRLEARAAARLSHPHVVAVYDVGTGSDDGVPFLVMERVTGRDLAHELAEHGAVDAERAVRLVGQAASGLAAAHAQGVVHRDVKPGNLLLADDGTVKVADFGIARVVDDASHALTTTGQIVGTSYYLAPERARGRPATPASDVYSLGCVLHQLLTAAPPFVADTPAGIAYQHVDTPPTPVGALRPALAGTELEAFVLRMMAKEPAERPTAQDVVEWAQRPAEARAAAPAAVAAAAPAAAAPVLPPAGTQTLPVPSPPVPSPPVPSPPVPRQRVGASLLTGRARRRTLVGAGSAAAAVLAALLVGATGSAGDAAADERPPAASTPSATTSTTAPAARSGARTTVQPVAATSTTASTHRSTATTTSRATKKKPVAGKPATKQPPSPKPDGKKPGKGPGGKKGHKGHR